MDQRVAKNAKLFIIIGIGILLVICLAFIFLIIPHLKPKPAPVVEVPSAKLQAFYVGSVKTSNSPKEQLVTLNITDVYKSGNEMCFEYVLTVTKIKSEALSYNKDHGKINTINHYLQFGADIKNMMCKYYKEDDKIIIESIGSSESIHLRLKEMVK